MKKWGWVLLLAGFACIVGGIVAKRVFDMREYLVVFHVIGGILIIAGGMLVFSDRSEER